MKINNVLKFQEIQGEIFRNKLSNKHKDDKNVCMHSSYHPGEIADEWQPLVG